MGKTKDRIENWPDYYDRSGILEELLEEPVHFSLDPEISDHQIPALPDIDPPLVNTKITPTPFGHWCGAHP